MENVFLMETYSGDWYIGVTNVTSKISNNNNRPSPFWGVLCKYHYSLQEPNYFHPCSLSRNLEPANMIENGSNHVSCWVFRGIINEYKVLGEFTVLFKY